MPARLVTIPFSHYCEKARWALARAGVDFVEDGHLPIYAYLALRRAGAGRTVPALITSDGAVVADSTDILRWCDAHGRAAPLAPATLAGVHLWFPDPRHKKKHHKRRLMQADFVAQLASRLAP